MSGSGTRRRPGGPQDGTPLLVGGVDRPQVRGADLAPSASPVPSLWSLNHFPLEQPGPLGRRRGGLQL